MKNKNAMAPLYTLIPLKEPKGGRLSCCTTEELFVEFLLLLEKKQHRKGIIRVVGSVSAAKQMSHPATL